MVQLTLNMEPMHAGRAPMMLQPSWGRFDLIHVGVWMKLLRCGHFSLIPQPNPSKLGVGMDVLGKGGHQDCKACITLGSLKLGLA